MQIKHLTRDDSLKFLEGHNLGRMACARDAQPYVIPIFFVYQAPGIYCFSAEGRKIEWLRLNPQACLAVDDITNGNNGPALLYLDATRSFPLRMQKRRCTTMPTINSVVATCGGNLATLKRR